ncbi:peroxiredoxin-like family protein [Shewanella waksmanii]|uniref:peroxiredoxin-like family protein n=1 Tax=Shewanella waksmanii TaxID=213783 RepID=UPI00048BF3C0|nr:peroxiredoxin-like family protein [Shewanella waksmanii]
MPFIARLSLLLIFFALPSAAKPIAEDDLSVAPLMNGQTVPSAQVSTLDGSQTDIAKLIDGKPSVIFFYRGGWCPFCNAQMGQLKAIEQDLLKMGFQLIGISPDSPKMLQDSLTDQKLDYTLVSDSELHVMRAFGLAYYTSEKTTERYRKKMQLGNKLWTTPAGDERLVLPVPAIYIVDEDGLVHFQYVNPNFRVRADPKLIITAASLIAD